LVGAYTRDEAEVTSRADEFGSLEVGKSADFIVLDRDIIALSDASHPEKIGETRVLETWFRGSEVYASKL
jgi:predicted amidohydrolase YtcJ